MMISKSLVRMTNTNAHSEAVRYEQALRVKFTALATELLNAGEEFDEVLVDCRLNSTRGRLVKALV